MAAAPAPVGVAQQIPQKIKKKYQKKFNDYEKNKW